MVTCKFCNSKFEPLWEDTISQANGCAANIFESTLEKRYLAAGYGSNYDGELYLVLTDEYETGIMCDACIEKGIKQNDFKLISSDNYFDLNLGE